MSDTLIMTMTDAGRLAMLNYLESGFDLRVVSLQLGSANYQQDNSATAIRMKWAEFPVINGYVDTENHVLRFVAFGQVNSEIKVSELGLFDENGVLFAVLSKPEGHFFYTEANTFFTLNFAVGIDQKIDGQKIRLSFNPQEVILTALLRLHLQHLDPHPQYKRFIEHIFRQHLAQLDPHVQYAMRTTVVDLINWYIYQVQRLMDLLMSFFGKVVYAGTQTTGSSMNVNLGNEFRGVLQDWKFSILFTPEGGHEAWSIGRGINNFSVNIWNRSGTSRVGYSGTNNWMVIDRDLENPASSITIPELVLSGVASSGGGLTVQRPSGDIDFAQCVFLMTPEGGHEAWSVARSSAAFSANIFNRSGRSRIGYSGLVSYAVLRPKDGTGEEQDAKPCLLMAGVSGVGTFSIVRPAGKNWDFRSGNFVVMITPEGGHEAWRITRALDRFAVSVFNRSGTSRIGYSGRVNWAIFRV